MQSARNAFVSQVWDATQKLEMIARYRDWDKVERASAQVTQEIRRLEMALAKFKIEEKN